MLPVSAGSLRVIRLSFLGQNTLGALHYAESFESIGVKTQRNLGCTETRNGGNRLFRLTRKRFSFTFFTDFFLSYEFRRDPYTTEYIDLWMTILFNIKTGGLEI